MVLRSATVSPQRWLASLLVHSSTSRAARLLGAASCVAALGLTTACGSTSNPPASAAAPAAPASAAASPAAGGQAMPGMGSGGQAMPGMGSGGQAMPGMGSGGLELYAVQTGPLGVVVTDGEGRLVYGSDHDMTNPPMSMCTGTCAQEWLPLVVPAGQEPDLLGVDDNAVGRVAREDGSSQLTLGGWPVYVNRHDDGEFKRAAPDAHGTWFAMTPQGKRVPV
jgi:predicted lipoprotein with Yx(FWY)xxD motif